MNEQKWIPCSERLPECDDYMLVTYAAGNATIGWFDVESKTWFLGKSEYRTKDVLAWMPLPEPYQEENVGSD